MARGFKVPYAGFPVTATLAQALRPYPQFTSIPVIWAPVGDSWYDALQVKGTQRASHGLTAIVGFTWSKSLSYGQIAAVNDAFNPQVNKSLDAASQPFATTIAINYSVPALTKYRWLRAVTGGWTLGTVLRYASGLPILAPYSNNNLNAIMLRQGTNPVTFADRVPGVPLYTADINCHCYDPNKTLILNPAAWTDPAAGQWGTSAPYYNDYRNKRRPSESMSIGRIFRYRERASLEVRAQFTNVFNRAEPADPTATNAAQPFTINNGQYASGFGWINTGSLNTQPRTGQIYARIVF